MKKIPPFNLLIYLILLSTLPLFFYKLGQSSLVSWDEAWYGGIARNILKTNDFFNLSWNGNGYHDHPPFGFWMIAISYKIFGINEFSTRFFQALAGFLSVVFLYFLGKELFNKTVGLLSALGLISGVWFLYRARSGNLDNFLVLFFISTIFFALKVSEKKIFLYPFFISFAFLILTKTAVPFTILPVLIVIFWSVRNLSLRNIFIPLSIFIISVGSWLVSEFFSQEEFIKRYLFIGLPGVKTQTNFLDNFLLIKEYIHIGIGKWFWPGIFGIILGPIFLQKRFLILSIFFISFFTPFLFSSKGHIWHLIPLHPFMILAFFGFCYIFLEKILDKLSIFFFGVNIVNKLVIFFILFLIFLLIYIPQIKTNWYQFIDIPAYISDEAILSKEAGKYPYDFYIDDQYGPVAYFYAEKKVEDVHRGGLKRLFELKKRLLIITKESRLIEEGIIKDQYEILKSDRDKILILKSY